MHELGKSLFRQITGKRFEEFTRVPNSQETVQKVLTQQASRYPVREIGWASDGETLLTEEDRESHIHILGAPGEGKSKLIELLIRQDIKRGYGCCLLDPNRGDTVYSVLRYCAKIGHDKVLLIDPQDIYLRDRICTINPFGRIEYPESKPPRYNKRPGEAIGDTMDTMRILWGDKGHEGTARINKYLPAVLKVLHRARATLHDATYFTDQLHPIYTDFREQMLNALHPLDKDRVTLESLFGGGRRRRASSSLFNLEFDSTIRRLNPLLDDNMKLMLGSNNSPVNFMKLVAEGWVILVNLDPHRIWGIEQERFLGTLIINELIAAVGRLLDSGWKGVYYVYVDEAGKYATPKIADILDYKRHLGIRFTLAHQRFAQFEDLNVRSSVKTCKIKVLFNTPSREDRDEMIRLMYGGDIPDRQVSYELGGLRKQEAAIKINKQPPRITRIKDLPEETVPDAVLRDYKNEIYRQECFYSREEILDEINARFTQPRGTSKRQPAPDHRPGSEKPPARDDISARPADGLGQARESEATYFDEVPPIPGEPGRHGEDPAEPRKRRGRPRKSESAHGQAVSKPKPVRKKDLDPD